MNEFARPTDSIAVLGLPRGPFNALMRGNVKTVGQLMNLDDISLQKIRMVGPTRATEIKEHLLPAMLRSPHLTAQQCRLTFDLSAISVRLLPLPEGILRKLAEMSVVSAQDLLGQISTLQIAEEIPKSLVDELREIERKFEEDDPIFGTDDPFGATADANSPNPNPEPDLIAKEPNVLLASVAEVIQPRKRHPYLGRSVLERAARLPIDQIPIERLGLRPSGLRFAERRIAGHIAGLIAGLRVVGETDDDQDEVQPLAATIGRYVYWLSDQPSLIVDGEVRGRQMDDLVQALPERSLATLLSQWLLHVAEDDRHLMAGRLGLFGAPMILAELGEMLDVTRERARQKLVKIQARLTAPHAFIIPQHIGIVLCLMIEQAGGLLTFSDLASKLTDLELSLDGVEPGGLWQMVDLVQSPVKLIKEYELLTTLPLAAAQIRALGKGAEKLLKKDDVPLEKRLVLKQVDIEGLALSMDAIEMLLRLEPRLWFRDDGTVALARWFGKEWVVDVTSEERRTIAYEPFDPADDSPLAGLETDLRARLEQVDLIGEISVTREEFAVLCAAIQAHAVEDGRILVHQVPAALFLTTMVFSSRYSDDQSGAFWPAYVRLVWAQESATQYIQSRCRRRYVEAANELAVQYGFEFPAIPGRVVVDAIFRHAIIPHYIQDDFARWVRANWRVLLRSTLEELQIMLPRTTSVANMVPTLRRFLLGDETMPMAIALIGDMAAAAGLYADGETQENIELLLADSPIRLSIWKELAAELGEDRRQVVVQRRSVHRLEWIWSIDDAALQLRLLNLEIESEASPYSAAWVRAGASTQEALRSPSLIDLDPFYEEPQRWLVDEVLFDGRRGPANGELVILSDEDEEMRRMAVPPLPRTPVQFFRLTQSGAFGVPVDANNLRPGRFLVCIMAGVQLLDGLGDMMPLLATHPVPDPLQGEYAAAGEAELEFPLTVRQGGTELAVLQAGAGMGRGEITMVGGTPISGVSRRVPPAFTSTDISLRFDSWPRHLLQRLTVLIRRTDGWRTLVPLRELASEAVEGTARLYSLRDLIPPEAGVYAVEVRRNLQSILPAPLQFSLLPQVSISGPDPEILYTRDRLPTAELSGVPRGAIVSSPGLEVVEKGPQQLAVRWRDLRQQCRLRITLGGRTIPLEWRVTRFWAWVEDGAGRALTVANQHGLDGLRLRVVGDRERVRFFTLFVSGRADERHIDLRADGTFETLIRSDQLYDMIRGHAARHVEVRVRIWDQQWPLLTVQKWPRIRSSRLTYDDARKAITLHLGIDESWRGRFAFRVFDLLDESSRIGDQVTVDRLQPMQKIGVDLPPGFYRLEVLADGYPLPLGSLRFAAGMALPTHIVDSVPELLQSMGEETVSPLAPALLPAYVMLLTTRKGQVQESALTPAQVMALAASPLAGVDDLPAKLADRVWPVLGDLLRIHAPDRWLKRNGLLPAWAVTSSLIRVDLTRLPNCGLSLVPELAAGKGRYGMGYTDLELGQGEKVRAYVRWEPSESDGVRLYIGVSPEDEGDQYFSQLDELDLFTLYFCPECGRFEPNQRGAAEARHRHILGKASFIDTLNQPDIALVGTVRARGRLPDLYYVIGPGESVGHHWLATDPILLDGNPYATAYVEAVNATRWRYETEEATRSAVDNELLSPRARQGIRILSQMLALGSAQSEYPLAAATGRLLSALPAIEDDLANPDVLDRTLLVLAFLLRWKAYYPKRAFRLQRRARFDDTTLATMLHTAHHHTPELLAWAMKWVELFYVHAIS